MKYCLLVGKNGPAAYLAHLEWSKAIERALRRSGLAVSMTQGFNRHFRMSFNGALAVGEESLGEFVEVAFDKYYSKEELLIKLSPELPCGMELAGVFSSEAPAPKLIGSNMIVEMKVEANFLVDKSMGWLKALGASFLADKNLEIEIARKSGFKCLRLCEYLRGFEIEEKQLGEIIIHMHLFVGSEGSIKPKEIVQAFWRYAGIDQLPVKVKIQRKRYFVQHGNEFKDYFAPGK